MCDYGKTYVFNIFELKTSLYLENKGLPVFLLKCVKHVRKLVGNGYFTIVPDVYCVIT